jgi:DNA-binding transcriptional MerR regulator
MGEQEVGYSLRDLARAAGVTPRTVHFYVQQGVLPPAGSLGPRARYGPGHLARLRLIKRLQGGYLPLAEIAQRIQRLTDSQVVELLATSGPRTPGPRSGAALDYVRTLLRSGPASPDARTVSPGVPLSPDYRSPSPAAPDRSQWERLALAPGIELHVRRPLSRTQQRQVERLLECARTLWPEEE